MESRSNLSEIESISCRISKRPPEYVKMNWPIVDSGSKKRRESLLFIKKETIFKKADKGTPIRKKKYFSSKQKERKTVNSFVSNKTPAEATPDVFFKKIGGLPDRLKSAISILAKKIRRKCFVSDFRNLKPYHLNMINDPCSLNLQTAINKENIKLKKKSILYRFLPRLPLQIKNTIFFKVFSDFKKFFVSQKIIFNPNSLFKTIWDMILIIITAALLFIFSIERFYFVKIGNRILDAFFIITIYCDLLVMANTKIFKEGFVVANRRIIVREILTKRIISHLLPCFLLTCTFLFDYEFLKYLNFVPLTIKITKNNKLSLILRDRIVRSQKADAFYKLIILTINLFFWVYILSVFWHFVGVLSNMHDSDSINWLKAKGIVESDWMTKYIFSMYWGLTSMLTVGYRDITPTNEIEMLYNIFAMVLGCCIFGYSMNKIGDIINQYHKQENFINDQMNKVKLMLQDKKLPFETQTKIKSYLEFVLKQDQKEDPEYENLIMNKLSSDLRNEIYLHTHVRHLEKVSNFTSFSNKTLISLARYMKKVCFSPEQYIYRPGDYENPNIFFVLNGSLSLVTIKDDKIMSVWKTFKENDHFGEREVFTGHARNFGVVSNGFSTLLKLNRSDIIQVLRRSPHEYERFCEIKDLDILYGQHHQYDVQCSSCSYKDHPLEKCEFLRYSPNKTVVLRKYLYKSKKKSKKFRRKSIFCHHALNSKQKVSSAQTEFLSIYNDDEELLKLQGIYESEILGSGNSFANDDFSKSPNSKDEQREADQEIFVNFNLDKRRNSSEYNFSKWKMKSVRSKKDTLSAPEEICEIKRPIKSLEESPLPKEKEYNVNSPFLSSKESFDDSFTGKTQKQVSYEIRENNIVSLAHLNPSTLLNQGKKDFKQCSSQNQSPCLLDLIKENLETRGTKSTFNKEMKPKKISKLGAQPKEERDFNQRAHYDSVKIFKFYFPNNNITEIIRKKSKKNIK